MTQSEYIFEDAAGATELDRLQRLESVFDGKTREWLLAAGPLSGRRCLEVGAGAGSIAAFLDNEVKPDGKVTALDLNTRFLGNLSSSVDVVRAELGKVALPVGVFDLVHARYVLIHNADSAQMLEEMWRALKPGGALVLEEPDFSAAVAWVAPERLKAALDNVTRGNRALFAVRGMDYAFGRSLPALLATSGANLVQLENDGPVQRGGSPLSEMMRLSVLALATKYVATGCVTEADLADYAALSTDPSCWTTYYTTVRVLARKPVG
jgi:SAM-dependent methyltransferase